MFEVFRFKRLGGCNVYSVKAESVDQAKQTLADLFHNHTFLPAPENCSSPIYFSREQFYSSDHRNVELAMLKILGGLDDLGVIVNDVSYDTVKFDPRETAFKEHANLWDKIRDDEGEVTFYENEDIFYGDPRAREIIESHIRQTWDTEHRANEQFRNEFEDAMLEIIHGLVYAWSDSVEDRDDLNRLIDTKFDEVLQLPSLKRIAEELGLDETQAVDSVVNQFLTRRLPLEDLMDAFGEDFCSEICGCHSIEDLGYWTRYFEPKVFSVDIAKECRLIPFSFEDTDGNTYDLLALGGCGMDLSPKLDAYQALALGSIDPSSKLLRDLSYARYVVGEETCNKALEAIKIDPVIHVKLQEG